MKLFFTRTENDDSVVIRYTSTWLYLLVGGITLMIGLSLFGPQSALARLAEFVIFWGFVALFVLYFIASRSIRAEILRAIRERRLTVTGSRFNPRNPLTLTITKTGEPS